MAGFVSYMLCAIRMAWRDWKQEQLDSKAFTKFLHSGVENTSWPDGTSPWPKLLGQCLRKFLEGNLEEAHFEVTPLTFDCPELLPHTTAPVVYAHWISLLMGNSSQPADCGVLEERALALTWQSSQVTIYIRTYRKPGRLTGDRELDIKLFEEWCQQTKDIPMLTFARKSLATAKP
jgi:hypothetical protein